MVIPHVHAHVNCDGTVIPHAYVLSEMVIPHIVCDETVIPHACVLSEMVIPHIVYDGMVIPHVIKKKKILVEDLRWDGHSSRRDSVVYVHPVVVFVVPSLCREVSPLEC